MGQLSDGTPRDSTRHPEGHLWQAAANHGQVCSHVNGPDKGSDVGAAPMCQVPPASDRQCHSDAVADAVVLRCPPADAAGAAGLLVASRQ